MDHSDDRNPHGADTAAMNTRPRLILIHGSWHDRSARAQVQAHLTAARVRSHAPTLRGHERPANRRQTFGASGRSDVYSSTEELLAIHRANLPATRTEAA